MTPKPNLKNLPTFEAFCESQRVKLTTPQIQIWELWSEKRRFAVVAKRPGWGTLIKMMVAYEELVHQSIENSTRKRHTSKTDTGIEGVGKAKTGKQGRSLLKRKRSKNDLKGQK